MVSKILQKLSTSEGRLIRSFRAAALLSIGFVLFCTFLSWYFPKNRIDPYITKALNQNKVLQIHPKSYRFLLFPKPGIQLIEPNLIYDQLPIPVSKLTFSPGMPVLTPSPMPRLAINAMGEFGDLSGLLGTNLKDYSVDLDLNLVALEPLLEIIQLPLRLSGKFKANLNLGAPLKNPERPTGKLSLRGSSITIPAQNVHAGFITVSFPTATIGDLELELLASDGKLLIQKLNLGNQSSTIRASIEGEISLQFTKGELDLAKSEMSLTINSNVQPDFLTGIKPNLSIFLGEDRVKAGKFDFLLEGTLMNPQFKSL